MIDQEEQMVQMVQMVQMELVETRIFNIRAFCYI